MDTCEGNWMSEEKNSNIQCSWIPATPLKPILPRPQLINTDKQDNQPSDTKCVRSEGFSNRISRENAAHREGRSLNMMNGEKADDVVNNWESTLARQTQSSIHITGLNHKVSGDIFAGWNNLSYVDLLARVTSGTMSSVDVATSIFRHDSDQLEDRSEFSTAKILLANQEVEVGSTEGTSDNCTLQLAQGKLFSPQQWENDLSALHETEVEYAFDSTITQIAPVTPDHGKKSERSQVSEDPHVCRNESTEKSSKNKNVTNIRIEQRPKKKKHRPKVGIQGETIKMPKQATPKPTNPTSKRKYTRRKKINDETSTNQPEVAGENDDQEKLDCTRKSCRRALNFDPEDQAEDKSFCEPPPNVISASYEQQFSSSINKPYSMVQNGQGSKRTNQNPQSGIMYELAGFINQLKHKNPTRSDHSRPHSENETPEPVKHTGKRKYVRKKRTNDPTSDGQQKVVEGDDDQGKLKPTRKSCRKALIFDLDDQARDSSSCRPAPEVNSASHEQQFCSSIDQSYSPEQNGQGCKMTNSINELVKDKNLVFTSTDSLCPLPKNVRTPNENSKASCQNKNCMEGTGQVITHGKRRTADMLSTSDTHLTQKSLTDPQCSTCASLGEETAREREHSCMNGQVYLSSMNLTGEESSTQAQEYRVYDFKEKMSCMNFSETDKRMRNEKGHSFITSSTSSGVATTRKVVRRARKCLPSDAKVNELPSVANSWFFNNQSNIGANATLQGILGDGVQNIECVCALDSSERLTKKRSKHSTQIRNLSSLAGIAESKSLSASLASQAPLSDGYAQGAEISSSPTTSIEALGTKTRAKLARRKRKEKRNSAVNSKSPAPTDVIWEHLLSVEAVMERLKLLNINQETKILHDNCNALVPYDARYQGENIIVSYNMENEEQNTLVVYGKDGTVVPLEASVYPVKRRCPRAKVDLDEETNRVWMLLLENIDNQGVDGTDEEKVKWWEEERRVFHGRANSFIARMHLVQGDRRFSQWKGSVVDSVVGVFLTQNVSDHLSSSAFMSLAAHFPFKPKINNQEFHEDMTDVLNNEPDVWTLNPEDSIPWKEWMSNNPVDNQSSKIRSVPEHIHEEIINSNKSFEGSSLEVSESILDDFGSGQYFSESEKRPARHISRTIRVCITEGKDKPAQDVLSSQSSVVSSENSPDTSCTQAVDRIRSYSEGNSKAQDPTSQTKTKSFSGSISFMELLQMAETLMHREGQMPRGEHMQYNVNLKDLQKQPESLVDCNQVQYVDALDGSERTLCNFIVPSSNHQLNLTSNLGFLEVDCIEFLGKEKNLSHNFSDTDNLRMGEHGGLTTETAEQANLQKKIQVIQETSNASKDNNGACNNLREMNEIKDIQRRAVNNTTDVESLSKGQNDKGEQHLERLIFMGETVDATESTAASNNQNKLAYQENESKLRKQNHSSVKAYNQLNIDTLKEKKKRVEKDMNHAYDWDSLRKKAQASSGKKERTASARDSLDWEAVRCADVNEIANTIKQRGMNNRLAERIKDFLNRLVEEHGSIDLEWLRDVPPDKAKEYLLSIKGLGLKSTECVRLLTLHHLAFPVDTNVGRIAVRLGWVPLQPLPESLQLHLLELYPVLESIQKYLWPRLCKLDQRTLYELHYQMITFGKVFCTKSKPNCNACPMRGECRHFASAFASARLALPGPQEKGIVSATKNRTAYQNPVVISNPLQLPPPLDNQLAKANEQQQVNQPSKGKSGSANCEPIIEEPKTPEPECIHVLESDIEDACSEDPDEIPTIRLNIEEFTQNLQNYMQENMELQEGDLSKALVALTPEVASIPMPKLKNTSRLRTEHQVYELPDSHRLLKGLDRREPDDPSPYLLAIWTPGETATSIQPPENNCCSQEVGELCHEKTCFACNSVREANSQIVRGTLLIPCRTAMRGSFPLNGTYFQVNEVFADHDSSLNPINVPRAWIWNLPRRTVYFGTSIPTIFKGLSTEGIQYCFWRGFVCVRGFDLKTRAPRPLIARLHFPASHRKGNTNNG